MVQAFDDVAPSGANYTNYDREHSMLYVCLLDRREKGRDWRETVRVFFGIDFDREPDRARQVYDSHLARAAALSEAPEFVSLYRMAPFL